MASSQKRDRHGASDVRKDHWPKGVYGISIDGFEHLGVHEDTGQLFWDGKEIVTKRVVTLHLYEQILATVVAVGSFGYFVLEAGKTIGWWQ
ncbi:hypothetical protein [Mesorhizobium sp. Z1-4]|uniref:hypothetical protein n=1 Tax=Mesorhizobium sp. Z1-4 TaxID=2448478 RepID=UPI000FD86A97|nr:hypothetical protein [Mesorhizobium sp. Z1-4]